MKPILLAFSVLLLAGGFAFGQSPSDQPQSGTPTSDKMAENREALKSLVAHYYEQLQFTPEQKDVANEIFDKYYDRYINTIGNYRGTAEQMEQLKTILKDAAGELKPHLDKEQWSTIVNLAAQRNIKLESWE